MLVDRELIDIFMSILQGQYYERLNSSVSLGFSGMEIMGERVEEGLKRGKIQGGSSSQAGVKKPFNRFKKNEGETNVISSQRGKEKHMPPASMPYFLYAYVAAAQYLIMPYSQVVPAQVPASSSATISATNSSTISIESTSTVPIRLETEL